MKIQEITLESIRFRFQNRIGEYMFNELRFNQIEEEVTRTFLYELETKILGQHNIQKYVATYDIPKNWWQHLVEDNFPKWYVKIFPVKHKKIERIIEFDHMTLLPDFKMILKGERVVMYTQKPDVNDLYKLGDSPNERRENF